MLSFRGILKLSLIGAALYAGADHLGFLVQDSDPVARVFGTSIDRRMKLLPESARIKEDKLPWSDSPWLASRLGINRAWRPELRDALDRAPSNVSADPSFESAPPQPKVSLPTLRELRELSPEARALRIADLPASAKFDLARMNFSYPVYRAETARLYKAQGNSHLLSGWALAATKLREPQAKNFTVHVTPDFQFDVPFYSSDVKSLMAWYLTTRSEKQIERKVLGRMKDEKSPQLLDPASFHVALANMIGKKGEPVILEFGDSVFSSESRPVVAYDSDIRIESTGHYRVSTTVEYTKLRLPQENPYGIQNWETDVAVFDYRLEVDSSGKIVRGSWIGDHSPLALWNAKIPKLDSGFELLEEIYQPTP